MKITWIGRVASLSAFILGLVGNSILGTEYWQAIVAGSLFGMWILFLNAD